jgi:hypothetical protein
MWQETTHMGCGLGGLIGYLFAVVRTIGEFVMIGKTWWWRLLAFLKGIVAVKSRVNGGWMQCSME